MRIAVSGTHRVGKSSLIEALAQRLPGYRTVDEPYAELEEEGYEFSDPPAIEDFEVQLRRSIGRDLPRDAIVDRCPLDFLAYLRALDADYDLEPWLDDVREAMAAFDRVVVVTIETPDRISINASEDLGFRRDVDGHLRALLLDDALGLDVTTIEVDGDLDTRVDQVLRALRA